MEIAKGHACEEAQVRAIIRHYLSWEYKVSI